MKYKSFFLVFLVVFFIGSSAKIFSYEFDPMEIQIINSRFDIRPEEGWGYDFIYDGISLSNSIDSEKLYTRLEEICAGFFNTPLMISNWHLHLNPSRQDFINSIKETFHVENNDDVIAVVIKLYYFVKIRYLINYYYANFDWHSHQPLYEELDYIIIMLAYLFRGNNNLIRNENFLDILNYAVYYEVGVQK
jgi:hypothetical protein